MTLRWNFGFVQNAKEIMSTAKIICLHISMYAGSKCIHYGVFISENGINDINLVKKGLKPAGVEGLFLHTKYL